MLKDIRIMHTGDTHLGTDFLSFGGNVSSRLRTEHCDAVFKMLENGTNYDVVLMAGDVFDSGELKKNTADEFLSCISAMPDVFFFWACGNHDFFESPVVNYCLDNKPDNLHIFSPEYMECVKIEKLRLCVYGRSFKNRHEKVSALAGFEPEFTAGYKNVLCMHGDFGVSSSLYNPVSYDELSKAGFDYAAFGHIHEFSGVKKCGNTYYSYCGCAAGSGFDECGEKGYVSFTITEKDVDFTFSVNSFRKFIDEKIDISDICSYRDLVSLMNDITGKGSICRVELVGMNNISPFIDTAYISDSSDALYMECTDSSHTEFNPDEYSGSISLKSLCASVSAEMISEASEEEQELIKKAFFVLCNEFEKK